MTFPACMILLPACHFKHSMSRTGRSVLQDFAHMTKKQKEISNVCVCAFFQSGQTRCIKTAQKMWESLYGGICMKAGIKHPSRVRSELVRRRVSCSYATFRTVRRWMASCPIAWFMCQRRDGEVGEHKNYDERKQKVRAGRQQDRHSSSPVWRGRKKKKTMMAGGIRGWCRRVEGFEWSGWT